MIDEYEYGVLADKIMTEETQETEEKTSRPVSLSTTNPIRADLILNLGCRGYRSATNRTSHGINNGQILLENLTVVQLVKNN
jgi:hypothetical protein